MMKFEGSQSNAGSREEFYFMEREKQQNKTYGLLQISKTTYYSRALS